MVLEMDTTKNKFTVGTALLATAVCTLILFAALMLVESLAVSASIALMLGFAFGFSTAVFFGHSTTLRRHKSPGS